VNAEGRERFFRAIAERIDVDRVEEVHVFPAIRQGGRESGVAVVTVRLQVPESEVVEQGGVDDAERAAHAEIMDGLDGVDHAAGVEEIDAADVGEIDAASVEEIAAASVEEIAGADVEEIAGAADAGTVEYVADIEDLVDASAEAEEELLPPPPPRRFTVLRAHYRLQLKGPDRGKWEVAVVEEADAPAATVDEVVRGVHERAGGWSVEGPERLTGDEFRAALVEEPWSATR
jgi:hypothetical protein